MVSRHPNDCSESNIITYYTKPNDINALYYHRRQHQFEIVKKSGNKTGIPTWKCRFCKQETKAT